jgi:hypothetical protein
MTAVSPWMRRSRNPRPVTPTDITEQMLAPIRRAADQSRLPQTVWPTLYFGPQYVGEDCLLISSAAVLDAVPADTAPGSTPLFSIIPSTYYNHASYAVADQGREGG